MWKTSVVVAPADGIPAPAPLRGTIGRTVENAARVGFDAVQLTVNRPSELDLAEVRAALKAWGIRASGIATGRAYSIDGISLGHGDEARRRAAVQRMKEHLDLAAELGGADVVVGLIRGTYADCTDRETYLGRYRASLEECIRHAEARRVRIVHEAIGRKDSDVLRTVAENIPFIRAFASPCFLLQVDTHHMLLEEADFFSAVLEAGALLAQVDISDVGRAPPDGKHFDFPRLMEALRRIGFRDHLVFEYLGTGEGVAEATAGLRYIRSLPSA